LPSLRSDQKAAAVNLGIFPGTTQPSYAYVPQPGAGPVSYAAVSQPARSPTNSDVAGAMPMSGDRLSSIDEQLRAQDNRAARPTQLASNPARTSERQSIARPAPTTDKPRVWVQLASGSNPDALPAQFRRIKSKHEDLLEGMSGYVAQDPNRSRLLIGPFRSAADAKIIVEDLESVRVDAFSWTSPPGQTIRKLSTE
jgi:hypothetical protein